MYNKGNNRGYFVVKALHSFFQPKSKYWRQILMANNRIFYACHNVQICGPSGTTTAENETWYTIQGAQSVGMNTSFNLEAVYQLGQLSLYDNYEETPEVEITVNKVLDGQPTMYQKSMGQGNLAELANNRCGIKLNIYPDTDVRTTGVPVASVLCQPSYLSTVTYTFPTEGNFTEECTFVSNDKVWLRKETDYDWSSDVDSAPQYQSPSGIGIMRRQAFSKDTSIFPTGNDPLIPTRFAESGGIPESMRFNNITVSMNLGREEIRELGRRTPFYRYISFPVEVTCEIECTANTGDMVGTAEGADGCNTPKLLSEKEIVLDFCDGMKIDLGLKNKLQSVNYTGGDTGGGNVLITYSYSNFNDFTYEGPDRGKSDINADASNFQSSGPGNTDTLTDGEAVDDAATPA